MYLNESQKQAVCHINGPLMVLAGPGSGKTTVITYRAMQLVEQGNIPPWQVLVITFSKAAAVEMEHRFNVLSQNSKNSRGGRGCTFGTFHGIFFRVLRRRYGYTVEQVLSELDRREIVGKLLVKAGLDTDEDAQIAVRNEISLVKNELHDLQYFNSNTVGAEEFRQLFLEYENEKRAKNKIDFDDMLLLCYQLWKEDQENLAYWQSQFPYIMIDEFQDINHVQYECMRMLSAKPHHLCIVGDDDQSIYRFRGARPEFLLRFPEDYPDVAKIVLETNYRSTDTIISFSNKVISQNQVRYDKTIVGTQKKGPVPKIITSNDQNREATYIASQIKKCKSLNEVAVIYRTNMQARAFIDAFLQTNIPYIVKDEISIIYEHWIARDIFAYLRLGNGFGTNDDIERIINKPFRFISKAFIQKTKKDKQSIFQIYTKSDMLNSSQQQHIEELILDLHSIKKYPPGDAVRYIRRRAGYDDYIKDYCDYRKINPGGLYDIAAELQESASAFESAEAFMSHADEAIANKHPKEEDERVTLTTMHSAKGLEFETVYIAGAVEGLIPHERSKTAAELEEERRLFYVGATRAKDFLFISVIKNRHEKKVKPSRFLGKTKL